MNKRSLKGALALILCLSLLPGCQKGEAQTAAPASTQAPETTLPTAEAVAEVPAEVSAPVLKTPEPTLAPMQAPEQTAAPTAAPTRMPVSDEQLDSGYLDSWFDGAVLVGDSLVAGLSGYVTNERANKTPCLGDMKLVSASALTLKKAVECERQERVAELKYKTTYMTVSQVVSATEAKRLFVMLGVSDLRWYSAQELIEQYGALLELVKAEHPDIKIYIHSLMPMIEDYARQVELDGETRRSANRELKAFCEAQGYTYLELGELVCDEQGYLIPDYSAQDFRFHLNSRGKALWVRLLREQAREEYEQGLWTLEEEKHE